VGAIGVGLIGNGMDKNERRKADAADRDYYRERSTTTYRDREADDRDSRDSDRDEDRGTTADDRRADTRSESDRYYDDADRDR
jgi:hypothetical protein